MEGIKDIWHRVRKNPETIHIKGKRFLKKKVYHSIQGRVREQIPKTLTYKQLKKELGTKELKINKTYFPLNQIKTNLKEADNICNKKYTIFGETYELKDLDWHTDFKSGRTWEKKHFSRLKYDFINDNSDKKIPWELSKFHHITTLGLAFKQTKEKKYLTEFKTQVENWIKENPYEIGINWVTPMEVAIRAINLIQGYFFFRDSIDDISFWKKYIATLYLHGKFIKENLEWSPAKENHYLSDLLGIFFLGTFFKHTTKGKEWIRFSKKELEKEIIQQVSEDGVDYEASINYHRLVTELFLLAIILGKENNITFSERFNKRVENMCNFIMHYTKPSGLAPSIGDTDNGRILDLWNHNVNDHRDILALASIIFNRPDFKHHSKWHNKLSLLINKEEYDKVKTEKTTLESKSFTDYYIIRDKDLYMLIHCGDIGRKGFGGHGHNDQLSFILSYKGKDYIIDPGTYAYTSDIRRRHIFRSTAYHNTPVINEMEQNDINSQRPFDMTHKTMAKCILWQSTKEKTIFIGQHQGFSPITIIREIIYEKDKIIITDNITSNANIELSLHLHPKVNIKHIKNTAHLDNKITIKSKNLELIPSRYSPSYGTKERNKKLRIKTSSNTLKTTISLQNS